MSAKGRPRIVALTAPSGAGKTTIARRVLDAIPQMQFSVSATTRPPRSHEVNGRDYHFVSEDEFRTLVDQNQLIEYEEVYPGRFYGTLHREVDEKVASGPLLLDVDVHGAMNVQRLYGDSALTIFIRPPSIDVLANRLRTRRTESEESLRVRLDRARAELAMQNQFDAVVVNDDLERAVAETLRLIRTFLAG